MYSVYFLKSFRDKGYYIGCTSKDVNEREMEHNAGQVKSTKNRRPFKLVYFESFSNEKEAFKREWHLKHPKGYSDKLEIIKKIEGI